MLKKKCDRQVFNLKSGFSIAKESWALLANRVEDICKGKNSLFDLVFRNIGGEYIDHHAAQELGFDLILV